MNADVDFSYKMATMGPLWGILPAFNSEQIQDLAENTSADELRQTALELKKEPSCHRGCA